MDSSFATILNSWKYGTLTILPTALCLAMVIANARRAPKASMLAAVGFGTLLTVQVMDPVISVWVTSNYSPNSFPDPTHLNPLVTVHFIERLLTAGAYLCLAAAIYAGRPRTPEEGPAEGFSGPGMMN